MRRKDTAHIDVLVREFLRANGMDKKLNQMRLIEAWPKVLGAHISNYTQDLKIHNRVLYVRVTSAALRSELIMTRQLLCAKLNQEVGEEVITEIHFL